jgi:hypothetical protein
VVKETVLQEQVDIGQHVAKLVSLVLRIIHMIAYLGRSVLMIAKGLPILDSPHVVRLVPNQNLCLLEKNTQTSAIRKENQYTTFQTRYYHTNHCKYFVQAIDIITCHGLLRKKQSQLIFTNFSTFIIFIYLHKYYENN